ncbi:MAG TPA: NAD(P)H-dependent oxidoreductase [Gaiellaceae bacterium]|jgi:chromate reductase|nr:NAD(P)H-dependent oxidoreductase [Gaiellaceae bacterium]
MRVLGISGSLRADSYNSQLLHAARELLPAGVEFELYDGLRELPPYDQDLENAGVTVPVRALRERIGAADVLLIATPEYNGSIPGLLKNAIDWASRPRGAASLANKPVAVIGATTGAFGGVWAQADTRKVLGIAGARVIEFEMAIPFAPDCFAEGGLVDPKFRAQLGELMRQLAEFRIADAA